MHDRVARCAQKSVCSRRSIHRRATSSVSLNAKTIPTFISRNEILTRRSRRPPRRRAAHQCQIERPRSARSADADADVEPTDIHPSSRASATRSDRVDLARKMLRNNIRHRYHAPSAAQYVVAGSRVQCAHGGERIASRRVASCRGRREWTGDEAPERVGARKRSMKLSIDIPRSIDEIIDRVVLIGKYICMGI